jgi:hypothetical protein
MTIQGDAYCVSFAGKLDAVNEINNAIDSKDASRLYNALQVRVRLGLRANFLYSSDE